MGTDSVRGVPVVSRLTDYVSLGVLSSVIHRDTVDDVIRECGKRELRVRLLPAHLVVYYVLALNLFFGEAYEEVMRMLLGGLRFLGNWDDLWKVPSTSAISQAQAQAQAQASVGGDFDLVPDNGRLFARIRGAVARRGRAQERATEGGERPASRG